MRKIYWSFLLLLPLGVAAQTLKDAAQQAVLTNPEIEARVHAFEAADGERDVAFGAFLPRLDVAAGVGRDHYEQPVQTRSNRNSTTVTLTQLIYDGFATSNEVDRLDFARRVRLFELYDITESTTLEVVRAYADVLRNRALTGLSEENYVRHRSVFSQISEKTNAGVGRRVDLEQAAGRLALAESNLLTDTSNLYDVSARFQRLVGTLPGPNMQMPGDLNKNMPPNLNAALKIADRNPALLAAIENVRSANSSAKIRNAAFQPRFDFRLRSDRGNNLSSNTGPTGDSKSNTAEVVMTWNLFNGGSDRARVRQYAEQINVARDLRDKTCRDLRQTLAIAYNDTRKLTEQLIYLDQHQLSIEKARDAYRMQFDIGQRSLLDVLDTENELFQAKRAYVNSEFDLSVAYARTNAGMGTLFSSLGLARQAVSKLPDISESGESTTGCPPLGPDSYVVDKDALNVRAEQLVRESVAVAAAASAARAAAAANPGATTATTSTSVAGTFGTPAVAPLVMKQDAKQDENPVVLRKALIESLMAWVHAWSARNVPDYLQAYSKNFKPQRGLTRDAWVAQRTASISGAQKIEVVLSDISVDIRGPKLATSTFVQTYRSSSYQDTMQKTLEWENVDGRWQILSESSKPVVAK